MEKRHNRLAGTFILASILLGAVCHTLLTPELDAQSKANPNGIDPIVLAKANAGDAGSALTLASTYQTGKNVPLDFDQAIFWYRKAAEYGDATAQYIVAWEYLYGSDAILAPKNYLPKDILQAESWFRKASEHADSIDTTVVMNGPSNASASELVAPHRGGGYSLLGGFFEDGKDVRQDYGQAALWYRKAAELGNTSAQSSLGILYLMGKGVPLNYVQAAMWLSEAAGKGDLDAKSALGSLYILGRGVPQDYSKALLNLKEAANHDVPIAQFNLATMYAHGQGVPQNLSVAYFFFDVAAARMTGSDQEAAEKDRDLTAGLLSSDELARVQELAAKWFSAHPARRK